MYRERARERENKSCQPLCGKMSNIALVTCCNAFVVVVAVAAVAMKLQTRPSM